MKTACPNIARKKYKYKMCRLNMTLFKRAQMRLGLLPDWSVIGRVTVKIKKIGTLKSNNQKKKGFTDENEKDILDSKLTKDDAIVMKYEERDESGPPGEADEVTKTSDFGKDAKGNGNEADLGQDTGQDTSDEKKDARTEENGMKEDDDEVQHDTLELRTVNEIFSPVADLRQDTRNEAEKNAEDPKPKESGRNMEVSEGIRDQGGGGVGGR